MVFIIWLSLKKIKNKTINGVTNCNYQVFLAMFVNMYLLRSINCVNGIYFRGPNISSWSNATSYCADHGSSLASIPTYGHWVEAKSVCGANDCWIGLYDDADGNAEGVWSWVDGTDIATSYGFNADQTATTGQDPWNTNEPNEAGEEDCVHLRWQDGRYNDINCDYLYYPLCNAGMSLLHSNPY